MTLKHRERIDHHLKAWCTDAVGDANSAGELDKIARGDQVALQEGLERVNGVVNTVVCMEVGLNIREDDH